MSRIPDLASTNSAMMQSPAWEWPVEAVVDWIQTLGLALDYSRSFRIHNVSGDVLAYLTHPDLEEIGVSSVGHRIRIIKSIRRLLGPTPTPSTGGTERVTISNEDLIHCLAIRDERMTMAEAEIRKLIEGYGRLREDLMPIFRQAKESKPLPTPDVGAGSVSFSSSASSNLGVMNHAANSGLSPTQPTMYNASPPVISPGGFNFGAPPQLGSSQQHLQQQQQQNSHFAHAALSNTGSGISLILPGQSGYPFPGSNKRGKVPPNMSSASSLRSPTAGASNPTSDWHDQTSRLLSRKTSQHGLASSAASLSAFSTSSLSTPSPSPSPGSGSGSSLAEAFKSFRIKEEDPCYKVLPAALRKYRITGDPRNYALVVCYDDQERLLEPEERPLLVFKELQDSGRKPVFMLRLLNKQGVSTPGGVL